MFPTLSVANYFIKKAQESGESLTPMKLLKLVYIAHGWYLANFNEPLIGEAVEAWKYGPVIPSLYQKFKKYRSGPITQQAVIVKNSQLLIPIVPESDSKTRVFLDKVWDTYSPFDGLQLSTMTHKDGTPWYQTWIENKGSEQSGAVIPNELIKSHYRHLLKSRGR